MAVLGWALTAPASVLSERDPAAHRIKAAFLYRFTQFTTWPDHSFGRTDAPFVIAVAGDDALAKELRTVTASRTAASRAIEVKALAALEPLDAAQILYVGDSDERLREWIEAAPRSALVVTESQGALELGAVINFVRVDGRLRFEVSLDAADRRELRLSSRLLAVAYSVRGTPP
jgi:hypothetical protein